MFVKLVLPYTSVLVILLGHTRSISSCKSGYFGWKCRFRCDCKDGISCDPTNGHCPNGCNDDTWGPGCLLKSNCSYNDVIHKYYVGTQTVTEYGHICSYWTTQFSYPDNQFADGSLERARNYCRNPKPLTYRSWCYYTEDGRRDWDYCRLNNCECPLGRFGINCRHECHCKDVKEACNQTTGFCQTGCDSEWSGAYCQESPYNNRSTDDETINVTSYPMATDEQTNAEDPQAKTVSGKRHHRTENMMPPYAQMLLVTAITSVVWIVILIVVLIIRNQKHNQRSRSAEKRQAETEL